jgi:fluoroacetyl-CoA thioesterase
MLVVALGGGPSLTRRERLWLWVPAFAGTTYVFSGRPMDARDVIKIGMTAERILVVPPERTVGHFVPSMPMVYATPMMILEMELASGDAIKPCLEPGWITVGTEVDIRHLAATPVGARVRTTARVIAVERRLIRFEVEAFDDKRRIGEGRHARGLVSVEAFTKRFGAG